MKTKLLIIVISFALSWTWMTGTSFAGGIKSRMIKRLPAIESLKAKGVIGENNKGYLEFRGGSREGKGVVNAENRDRKTVYTQIAKSQGATVEVVGRHRAAQIEKKADPGEWLQDANGRWYRK